MRRRPNLVPKPVPVPHYHLPYLFPCLSVTYGKLFPCLSVSALILFPCLGVSALFLFPCLSVTQPGV